jgi:hypothetical protein
MEEIVKIKIQDYNDIADEIRRIDQAMQAIRASRLREETVVILVQKLSGENKTSVKSVLYGLSNLKRFIK